MNGDNFTPGPWHLGGIADPLGDRPTTWVYGNDVIDSLPVAP